MLWGNGHNWQMYFGLFPWPFINFGTRTGKTTNSSQPSTAGLQNHCYTFFLEKSIPLHCSYQIRITRRTRGSRWFWRFSDFSQFLISPALDTFPVTSYINSWRWCGEYRLAAQLTLVFFHIWLCFNVCNNNSHLPPTIDTRCMSNWIAQHDLVIWFKKVERKIFIIPANTIIHERLDLNIG